MYVFGNRSNKELETMHADLRKVFLLALSWSQVDFGLSQGARTFEQQLEYFTKGASKVDPRRYSPHELVKKAKHIVNDIEPLSRAGDLYIYVPGKPKLTYDITHIMYVVGVITAAGAHLLRQVEISHKIRSGANWDGDGELRYDQTFFDSPHIELIKP